MSLRHLDDKELKSYFSGESTVTRWWVPEEGLYAYHFAKQLKVLEHHGVPSSGTKVLDVGTGRGMFSIWFALHGCRVDAVDINPEMLNAACVNAKKAGVTDLISFHEGDAEDLNQFEEMGYDWVSCMQTFDHIPNLEKAVESLVRRLKPGGRFIFTYVPLGSLYAYLYRLYGGVIGKFYQLNKEGYLVARMYSNACIDELLKRSNIDIDRYYGIGLTCLALRPEFERGILTAVPRWLNQLEEAMFPFYKAPFVSRHCTHVVGIGRKK